MNLDDRLREILVQSYDIDAPETVRLNHDNAIAQIKAAFKDEGWQKPNDFGQVSYTLLSKNDGSITIMPTQPGFMTGQEWYEAFEKEWTSKPIILNVGYSEGPEEWVTRIDARVKDAAKRASNLEGSN